MKKKIISMLGLMFLVSSCQPQADNNNMNDGTNQMDDSSSGQMDRRSKAMQNNGRSSTRSLMNNNPSGGNTHEKCGSCGSCDCDCEPCGPCCDNTEENQTLLEATDNEKI
jgi:hypothetical protein